RKRARLECWPLNGTPVTFVHEVVGDDGLVLPEPLGHCSPRLSIVLHELRVLTGGAPKVVESAHDPRVEVMQLPLIPLDDRFAVGVCCPCGSTVADLPFGQVLEGPPQVLMHIQHDGVAAARVPAHRLFQPVEILLVVFARLWLYSSPGDEQSHELRAHSLVRGLNALLIDVRETVGGGFRPAISRETVQDQCPALRVGDEPGRSVRRRRNTSRHGSRDDEYCDTREKKPNPHYRRSADM